MKHLIFTWFVMVIVSNPACGMTFVHPGALNSNAELNFVKSRMQKGTQPWKSEFDQLKNASEAFREPHGLVHLNSKKDEANVARDDATAAYA